MQDYGNVQDMACETLLLRRPLILAGVMVANLLAWAVIAELVMMAL